jgi:hypothetical protein
VRERERSVFYSPRFTRCKLVIAKKKERLKKIENRVHLSVLPRDFVVSRLFSAFYHAFVRFFAGVRLWLKLFKR